MYRLADFLCRILVWIGGGLMLIAVFITVGDVIARAIFKTGYIGIVDLTQFAVIGFAYLAMPLTFLKSGHVAIGLYDHRLSKTIDALLRLFSGILAISILCLLLYYGWTQANRTLRYGDVSQNIEIPMIWFWILVLGGAAVSLVICVLQLITNIMALFVKEQKDA